MPNRRNLRMMYAISLLQGMVFYGAIATLYRQAAGVSVWQIAVIEGVFMALCILLELPWGMLADRIGYRRSMIICCFLYVISKLVFWRASNFSMFLLERVLLAVVCAGMSGVDSGILYLSSAPGQSHKAFGIYQSLGTLGMMVAALVYARASALGYRFAGLLTVFSYALSFLFSLGLQEVKPERSRAGAPLREFTRALREAAGDRRLMTLLFAFALINVTHQVVTVFFCQLQYQRCGLSDAAIARLFVIMTALGLLSAFSARATKLLGEARLSRMLCALCAAACLVLAFTQSALLSALSLFAFRLAFQWFQPLQMEIQNRAVTSADRATALSIYAVLMDAVSIPANMVLGRIADANVSSAMALSGVLCAFALIAVFLSFSRKRTV